MSFLSGWGPEIPGFQKFPKGPFLNGTRSSDEEQPTGFDAILLENPPRRVSRFDGNMVIIYMVVS